jgi:hypothetical protein
MKPGNRTLALAGVAGIISLLLISSSVTISLTANASPPASGYLNANQNAHAVGVVWALIASTMTFLVAIGAMAQVVLRRPILTSTRPVSNLLLAAVSVATLFIVVCSLMSVWSAIASIHSNGQRPVTDNTSYAGMGLSMGLSAMSFASLCLFLFQRWWHGTCAAAQRMLSAKPETA